MALPNPVIVVPGITGSELRDVYDLDPRTVFALLSKSYESIALHPDNLKYERIEPTRVVPDKLIGLAYRELIEELRHDLRQKQDEPVPVYPFAYDWRQRLNITENLLRQFIEEVIERTKLLPHYAKAGYPNDPKVNLVGHSMGGLIVAGYMESQGRNGRVGKVATLGSPFRGSLEAPVKVATGLADLGTGSVSSREREAARVTPALYHLLPSFDSAIHTDVSDFKNLYKVKAWQPGVIQTIAEYIRLYGLKKTERTAQAEKLLGDMLGEAEAHRNRLEGFDLPNVGLKKKDWLCIVGVDEKTRVSMRIKKVGNKPWFELSSTDQKNMWEDKDPANRVLTGDGTVPYQGAKCNFIPVEQVVCVLDNDFGTWELQDRTMEGLVSLHALLPKMNLIQRLIVSHFTGKKRPGTWGRSAPDLPADKAWDPPIPGLKPKKKDEKKD